MLTQDRKYFLLLNAGHFLDHFFMLIFATAAALALTQEWQMSYGALIPYATPGFVAFGLGALPAGWLADRWSRDGMMTVFFVGIGLTSIATGFSTGPVQISAGLFGIGLFGAIYHPVGLAIVTTRWRQSGMRIAVNGVWGNLGVGCAALLTGILIAHIGWREAFILPGIAAVLFGLLYHHVARQMPALDPTTQGQARSKSNMPQATFWRVSVTVLLVAILGSIVFQATTFALPKIFDERLAGLAEKLSSSAGFETASIIGFLTFTVFAAASAAQLVVGYILDRHGARVALFGAAVVQVVFFLLVQGQTGLAGYAAALGFMLGVFGEIPINDYLVGTLASGKYRARVFGARYLVSFTALAMTLPLIAVVHEGWGFDTLFLILAALAALIGVLSMLLPRASQKTAEA